MMDSQALERIYREQVGRVYRLCCCYLKNRADAEDVTQDAFVQLMRSGKRLEGTEHEKAWLLRTAANLCRNRLKHWSRRNADIDTCVLPAPEEPADEVVQTVLGLPDRYKMTVFLYYYEGYPVKDIARMLRRPASTVRNHLSEARKMLKDLLEEQGYEE